MSRQIDEQPYYTTGEVVIEIRTGLKGSARYVARKTLTDVRYCGKCLCLRPMSEFVKSGRQCLQCRDPKKDLLESKG